MNLSELKPAAGSKHSDEFRRGRGHQEMVKLPEKVIKDRKHVLEHLDQVSKVVSCHCTEDCLREVLQISIVKTLLLSDLTVSMHSKMARK